MGLYNCAERNETAKRTSNHSNQHEDRIKDEPALLNMLSVVERRTVLNELTKLLVAAGFGTTFRQ